ncbi:MAG: DNA polymerase III subunit delta' [Polyangiaceae bacterium]
MSALLSTVRSQPTAVQTLRRALGSGRLHHAYLFDGPDGVGKERTAFGLAQALVCERRAVGSADACGACSACSRSVPRPGETRPVHPDVVVIERGLYEPAAIGRRSPESQEISIDQVRTLVLARASFPPYEGHAKVFIVRRADELSIAAANALLKTLEEPGARTCFVLLCSSADALLPTIRSRTQRVRFGVLPDEVVAELLGERGVERERAQAIACIAGGTMASAVALADGEASARRDAFLSRAMAALDARDLGPSLEFAEETKKADRHDIVRLLEALALALGAQARGAAATDGRAAVVAAVRHELVVAAVEQIEASASAQLAVEALMIRMRAA